MGFREIRGEREPRTGESDVRWFVRFLVLSLPLFLFAFFLITASSAQAASAPTNTSIPTISGTPELGQSLTAAPGTWSADPAVDPATGYSYQWQRCEQLATPAYADKWGSQGTADGQFSDPVGAATDAAGNVYIADTINNRIQKFSADGTFITKWGSFGTGDGQFDDPRGVAVDSSGKVYVADTDNSRVQKFTSDGTFITKWGSNGTGNGQFDLTRGIAIDSQDNVYVTDFGNNRVQKFSSDGTFITKWGSTGTGDGQFDVPVAPATDSQDNVYVTDFGNNRVQKFSSDGTLITKWGSTGTGDGQFRGPIGLAVDFLGNVYVSDYTNNRVQKFSSDGTFITKWGSTGTGDGQFDAPQNIAFDPSGTYLYVVEQLNDRVQAFNTVACSDITGATNKVHAAQPDDYSKYLRVKVTADNGVDPDGVAYSAPTSQVAGKTLYVNKYSPNKSDTPGCANAPYTNIGTAWPAPSGAVGAALSGDTIFICGSPDAASAPNSTPTVGPYAEETVLGSKDLNLLGDGPSLTIIDGQNSRTPFYANEPGDYLNFASMTIKRGRDAVNGGALETVCRDVNISNVNFTGNVGFFQGGGAIYTYRDGRCLDKGDVEVTSSTFTGNVADGGNTAGGVIYANGSVYVEDSVFQGNEAYAPGGTAKGGAIFSTGTVSVTGSTFSSNSVNTVTGATPVGGAIQSQAGVTISRSSFLSNSAIGPGAIGGAVHTEGGSATITGSTFASNSTKTHLGAATGFGGAVRRQAGDLTVTNSTFTGNSALYSPAVYIDNILTLVNVTSSDNSGPSDLYAGGDLRIGNSIIDETGEACTAGGAKINDGGNVIANTTADTGDCLPFVGGGGGPVTRVAPSTIELQPLADNGGPTKTMALGLGSVAANSVGVSVARPATDQRGFVRPPGPPDPAAVPASSGAYQLTGPENTAIPQISGTAQLTQTLSASNGSWTVSPPVTGYSYQWQRCEVSASPSYILGSAWGGPGSGNGQFSSPGWVATDKSGNVFVGDIGNNRIQKFDATGKFLGKWGSAGSLAGQFQTIGGIAVGPGGDIYVSDSGNNRVQQFTNAGAYIRQWGSLGTGDGQFNNPTGVATDASGNVYVSDYNNQRVQKFNSSGGFLTKWGSSGSGPGQFVSPGAIATDSSGNVYVVDIYSQRVEKFTSSGTFLTQWGSNGSGNGQFTSPTGIAVDSSGNVYVADRNTSRIQAFSPQGTFLFKWGTSGNQPGEIDDPSGLAFGAGGDLYEADSFNARIQRFAALNCAAILGGTEPTYRPVSADLGKTIRVRVTATNGVDPAGQALSAPTAPVDDPPPPPSTYVLAVNKSVSDTGTGTVTSIPSGINCGLTCQKTYDPGAQVTLEANASPGSRFTGWTGACTNQQGPCTLTMTDNKVVTARFTAVDTYRLTVDKQGTGQGTVTSSPAGIDCGSNCESSFNDGEEVTLTASAAQGSAFTGWSGACTGTAPCQVTMDQARSITATFTEDSPPPPPFSDVGIELNTAKPAKVPSSRTVQAVKVSCEGDAPCRINSASATARARGGADRNASVSFSPDPFPAGTSRVIQVTIPKSVYDRLRTGKKSGLLTVEVEAQGTEDSRQKTLKVGLLR